jgi:putative ABC transport system substrate-binding protein
MSRGCLTLSVASVLALLFSPVPAQQTVKIPSVGVLVTHAGANDSVFENLRTGLREYGYEDGRNIKVEILSAGGHLDLLPALAQQLVAEKVDVIICPNEASTRAAMVATRSIPIVMLGFSYDPVALGLVETLGRPGGNVTGLYSSTFELEGKRLEILKEALPGVSRVAAFWEDPFGRSALDDLQRAARSLSIQLDLVRVRKAQELESAFKTAKAKRAGAILLVWSPTFYVHRAEVATLALRMRMPTVAAFAAENGALISYGADNAETFKHAAYYVDRLLKGAKPGELPVEQMSKLKLSVNLRTAKTLGITIPESILQRADEVIR